MSNSFWAATVRELVSRSGAPFYLSSLPYWTETRQTLWVAMLCSQARNCSPHTLTLPLSGKTVGGNCNGKKLHKRDAGRTVITFQEPEAKRGTGSILLQFQHSQQFPEEERSEQESFLRSLTKSSFWLRRYFEQHTTSSARSQSGLNTESELLTCGRIKWQSCSQKQKSQETAETFHAEFAQIKV